MADGREGPGGRLGVGAAAGVRAGRVRRALRLAPVLIGPWAAAAFLAAQLSGIAAAADTSVADGLLRALLAGALIGTLSAWVETQHLAAWSRRLPLAATLALRTVLYAVIVGAVVVSLITIVSWQQGTSPLASLRSPQLQRVLDSGALWAFVTLLIAASFVINFGLQIRRVLGPETLRALFLGTYRRPVREERAFAFLDLTDSTAWAERLGPLRFTDFKNDFFADVAEPVLATGGRIVQYVGDEVMVSWPMARALRDAAPLRFFFLVQDRVAARADRYRQRYGAVPAFKAGVHGGWVVTAEVGDLKRDIVHSGDVVNTAARIEGECRPRGRTLLVSDELMGRMPTPDDVAVTDLGPAALRGKSEAVGLVSVTRA